MLPAQAGRRRQRQRHAHQRLGLQGKTNLFWDEKGEEQLSKFGWDFLDRILTHALDLCLIFNSSVNAYRRLDPHFEAPNQIRASAVDRGAMIRVPIGNSRSMRTEVRAVAPDANPYLSLYSIFKTGIDGEIAKRKNLREVAATCPTTSTRPSTTSRPRSGLREILGCRCAGPLRRPERSRRQPLSARAGNHRQGLRGAVPPRGLQPVAVEFVLERARSLVCNANLGGVASTARRPAPFWGVCPWVRLRSRASNHGFLIVPLCPAC